MKRPWIICAAIAVFSLTPHARGDINLEDIKGKEWPGHNPDFSGPGNPDKLAAAALEFLEKNPNWSRPEYDDVHIPYAASVSGTDWAVSKKAPLTHQPTQYSLNILVAFKGEKNPDTAYVYHMVFYTKEEAGVEKGLPFRYANSRQYSKYKVPLKLIKKSGGGGASFLWRLVLGLALIAGGLVAAGKLLAGRIPPLKTVLPILRGLALPVGCILTLLGLGGFLCNLARLAPHASVLPQLVAVALGIALLREAVKGKAPEPAAPTEEGEEKEPPKPSPLAAILAKFSFLDPTESSLGIAAIVLGLLHIVAGGFALI